MKKIAFALLLLFLFPVLVAGAAGREGLSRADNAALDDIPPEYFSLYVDAATDFGFEWELLAAVGKIECDHGRGDCYRPNSAGAMVISRWILAFRHVSDERASSRAAQISARFEARTVRVLDS